MMNTPRENRSKRYRYVAARTDAMLPKTTARVTAGTSPTPKEAQERPYRPDTIVRHRFADQDDGERGGKGGKEDVQRFAFEAQSIGRVVAGRNQQQIEQDLDGMGSKECRPQDICVRHALQGNEVIALIGWNARQMDRTQRDADEEHNRNREGGGTRSRQPHGHNPARQRDRIEEQHRTPFGESHRH